jgi:hypothetical protein
MFYVWDYNYYSKRVPECDRLHFDPEKHRVIDKSYTGQALRL